MISGASTMLMRRRDEAALENSPEINLSSFASMTRVCPTSCTVCAPSSSCRASKAPAIVALGAKSPPIASNAIRAKLGFLRFYSLFAIVVSALRADVMRTPHALAAGTLLDDDRRRDLVRIARAFLSLGGASLWDGHCNCSLKWFDELVCVALMLAQRVPARFSPGLHAIAD